MGSRREEDSDYYQDEDGAGVWMESVWKV